jgi:hypothetical protein
VVIACVLSISPVSVMSAPVQSREAGPSGDAKWIKPCGMGGSDTEDASLGAEFDSEMVFAENEELSNIVLLARTAQGQANRFRDDYVSTQFILKR